MKNTTQSKRFEAYYRDRYAVPANVPLSSLPNAQEELACWEAAVAPFLTPSPQPASLDAEYGELRAPGAAQLKKLGGRIAELLDDDKWNELEPMLQRCMDQINAGEHAFKNFHRALCARFDYMHDERDWKRDQISLEEHIAKQLDSRAQLVERVAVLEAAPMEGGMPIDMAQAKRWIVQLRARVDSLIEVINTPHPHADEAAKVVPDDLAPLMKFYAVDSLVELARIQDKHIAKLQAKLPKLVNEFPRTPREG